MFLGAQQKKRSPCFRRDWRAFEKQDRYCTRQVISFIWLGFVVFLTGVAQKYQCSFTNCIEAADYSAAALVNILAEDFPCFNDVASFESRKSIRFLKRAQICVADIWAAFDGEGFGEFEDIDKITMFADYRVPQILNSLGCLWYNPSLDNTIRQKRVIESGHPWEIQLRGSSSITLHGLEPSLTLPQDAAYGAWN
jgi:hypothetical protein